MPTRPKSHTLSRVPRVKPVCCLRSDVTDPVGTYTPAYGSTSTATCVTAPSADREQRTSGATSARINERLTSGGPFLRSTHVKVQPSGGSSLRSNGSRLSCGRLARRRKAVGRSPCPARAQHSASSKAITARQLQALVRPPSIPTRRHHMSDPGRHDKLKCSLLSEAAHEDCDAIVFKEIRHPLRVRRLGE